MTKKNLKTWTDGRKDGRTTDATPWHKLIGPFGPFEQKRAIRIINHAGFLSHTNNLFHQNRILKITDLFNYNVGIFMYNLSAGELPDVFLHMFRRNSVVHNYPTRQRDAFHLPRTRTIFAKKQ